MKDNRIYATGGNGIYLRGYNARNVIRHNEIAYVGGNGVGLGGAWGLRRFNERRRHAHP